MLLFFSKFSPRYLARLDFDLIILIWMSTFYGIKYWDEKNVVRLIFWHSKQSNLLLADSLSVSQCTLNPSQCIHSITIFITQQEFSNKSLKWKRTQLFISKKFNIIKLQPSTLKAIHLYYRWKLFNWKKT